MLNNQGKRMLAYVQEVGKVEPLYFCKKDVSGNMIPDLQNGEKVYADVIEKIHVLGWTLIAKKGEFKEGDKCVFFEIDSKVPANKFLDKDGKDIFEFLADKHYAVKTYKLNKFGVWSQGLALPLSIFNLGDLEVGTDLTETLGVTYSVGEDNFRKSSILDTVKKQYIAKHKRFFNNKFIKWFMRFKLFRKLVYLPVGKDKKYSRKVFPEMYVQKTDEERIQNMPYILEDKQEFIATEKIDGTSTTWLLVRKPFGKFEFYVCSRNVRMLNSSQECFGQNDNIYWENAITYDVENQLKKYIKKHKDLKWVCIQGESYGEGWQGNPLKQKGHKFAAFNFKDSKNGRWGSLEAKKELESWEKPIPWVPILDEHFVLPDTVEELLKIATAKSKVNPNVLREGIVFRSKDGKISFKAVSPDYLAKHHL